MRLSGNGERVRGGITFIMSISNITILVVDAQAHTGATISQVLNSHPAIRLVVTHNYAEAEKQTAQLLPTIIWLQMDSDHAGGIAEILQLKKLSPASRIIVIVLEEDEQQAFAAIMAGSQGYCRIQEIEQVGVDFIIQMLSRDEFVLRPALLKRLLQRLRATALGKHAEIEGVGCLSW